MLAVTSKQMRKLDNYMVSIGVPGLVLMENAASAIVREVMKENPGTVLVFCGKGQNGGDGLAAARQLFSKGINVKVILPVPEESITKDAKTNLEAVNNMGIPIDKYDRSKNYACDVLVDALLGTGLSGDVDGVYKECIKCINESGAFVISADIPSGISADSGRVCGCAVKAAKTVTFGFCKQGLFSPLSADYVGEVILDEISIPRDIPGTEEINTFIINDIKMPEISKSAHKGTLGRVLVAGGKRGMTGAVYLAAKAAMAAGAGLVTCAVPGELVRDLNSRLPLAVCSDIDETDFGAFDALVIGNGMGTGDDAAKYLDRALLETKKTLVIDADGINLLAQSPERLKNCRANVILTPHPAEFSRLTGKPTDFLIENRIECAREFSIKYGVTLVFKGAFSAVTFSDKTAYINNTGNEGMAKGGSGDVLAGIVGALANHFDSAERAALAGVYLHGLAGDIAKEDIGAFSMTAEDIISYIPKAFKKI